MKHFTHPSPGGGRSVLSSMVLALAFVASCDAEPESPAEDLESQAAASVPGKADGAGCAVVDGGQADFAPVQVLGGNPPASAAAMTWVEPTSFTDVAPVSGATGAPAGHEGVDYVHPHSSSPQVAVVAAAAGTVVYVRTGCPQSSVFGVNWATRECGAGWGDHVVIHHAGGLFTRYAHLQPGSVAVTVGESVAAGESIAEMGNSGRSDVRHLHFELGTKQGAFDSCGGSQSFDRVYRAERLPFGSVGAECVACIEGQGGMACADRCTAGQCRACVEGAGGLACVERCEG